MGVRVHASTTLSRAPRQRLRPSHFLLTVGRGEGWVTGDFVDVQNLLRKESQLFSRETEPSIRTPLDSKMVSFRVRPQGPLQGHRYARRDRARVMWYDVNLTVM